LWLFQDSFRTKEEKDAFFKKQRCLGNHQPGKPRRKQPLHPGIVTAGANNTTHVGVSYNSLRIQGYAYGAHGLPNGLSNDPDDCIFPNVDLTTEFGQEVKTKARIPLMTGALGSTFVAAKYWDSFAIGGSLVGIREDYGFS